MSATDVSALATPDTTSPREPRRRGRIPRTIGEVRASMPRLAWWVVCLCLAILFLYPLYVMLTQSLKAPAEAAAVPPTMFPQDWSLENYAALADSSSGISLLRSLGNSIGVSLSVTLLTTTVATLAGYGFAKLPFRGSGFLFFLALVAFMVPFQAIITPLFLTLRNLGLLGSLPGLVLVIATFSLPFGLFLMRNTFASLPGSLEEAAMIDGCGTLGAMRRVLLPVALPGVISTALLTFFTAWNEFFATLILLVDQKLYTLPVSLQMLASGQNNQLDWGVMQAGVTVTVVPCVVIYLLLQKYYVSGLLSGAVK
ncbi:carbohydrate ABC transporter permease [Cellulomonas triticagri]|nr:carbohydrate ABC transporter permease [Cellulomonas triticagri]